MNDQGQTNESHHIQNYINNFLRRDISHNNQ